MNTKKTPFKIIMNNIDKMFPYYLLPLILLLYFQPSMIAQSIQGKQKMSLNGTWDIIFDEKNEGISQKWYLDKNFEDSKSYKKIEVPSCWEELKKNYEGVGIYRTTFRVPENWKDEIIELNFDAVNYKSEIWLNDQVVGFHEGGYNPFSFRVDQLIHLGKENILTIRVVSPIILTDKYIDGLGRQEVPMWRGAIAGGIWQSVSISAKGKINIKDVFIEPKISNNTAVFNIEIQNTKTSIDKTELMVRVLSNSGKEITTKVEELDVLPGNNNIQWKINIPNAEYWSGDNPYLYKAEIKINTDGIITDQWESKFGMREFTIKEDAFCLNGKPLYLKAAFFEGLYPTKLAYPDSREMAIKEIQLAKDAGFNMIRPWRKPAPKMWLDLCDEMGMLTVGSLVVECMGRPISTPRLPFVVENELRQTILSNRNRTCIVQWELFNEINRPILAQMLNSMSTLARELDPTRLILDESGGWGKGANIYLPYERTPKKFNDIHHYSGSQINETEFNSYLATAKTKEQLETIGLANGKGNGKNVVSGMMSYFSEVGYGSTPNLTENNKEFALKGNPIVAPTEYHKTLDEGFKSALKKVGFDSIYPNVADFYLEQQKMHGIANKRILEAIRLNPTVKGFCVHALTDGDWVLGAGLIDLWRKPKPKVYNMTKEACQKQIMPIRILPRNVYAEKGSVLEIFGVNELANEKETLTIRIISESGKEVWRKSIEKNFSNGISSLFKTKLNTQNYKGNYTVKVEAKNATGKIIASNYQDFDVFNETQIETPKVKIAVVDPENSLSTFLKNKNIEFVPFQTELKNNTLVLVGKSIKNNPKYKKEVAAVALFVKKGGYAIVLDVMGKNIPAFNRKLMEVEADSLPFGANMHGEWATLGGWAAKSHIVTKHPIFNGLPTNMIMHGVYENVHPKTSMSKQKGGNYIAGMIGYDHFPDNDDMKRHYNGPGEVWWAADVLEVAMGKGKMLFSTLRIIENLGLDPVADKILFNMIEYASNQ
jgi:beta-galactosidase